MCGKFIQLKSFHALLFVRRTNIGMCSAGESRMNALLGRFLPRLGPPVATWVGFFLLQF